MKLSDGHVEIDETGLFSFIEDGKCAGDLQAPANCFLSPRLLVHEHGRVVRKCIIISNRKDPRQYQPRLA